MWPFAKKEPERDYTQETIEKLRSFRDVGEKFNYMGIEMIVERHCDFTQYGSFPKITAAYKNNNGELNHAEFWVRDLPALRAENP